MNAQNEKPIEYEAIPLWQHPLSIMLVLGILIAGGSWYINREQAETNKTNILKEVSAPVDINNTKQTQNNNQPTNQPVAKNKAQVINNTQIKQVNPNDIAVVRVHDADDGIDSKASQSSLSTLHTKSRRIAQEVEELESRLIADEVEALESALQEQQQDMRVKSSTTQSTEPTSMKATATQTKDKQIKVSDYKVNNKQSIIQSTQSTPATKKKSITKTKDKTTTTTGKTIAKSTTSSATNPTDKTVTKPSLQDNTPIIPIASPTNPQPITRNKVLTPPSSEINLTKEQISQLAQELIEVEKDMEIDSTTY